MGKKRKSRSGGANVEKLERTEYPVNETFDDSEDEFYAHRDKILVDEAPAAKRRRKLEEQYADLQPSDEEVFEDANGGRSDEDDEALNEVVASGSDEDPDTARRQIEDEEDERFWGTERKDYYNADLIETEADALEEEAEARRLQQKQLKSMTEADFGFDESEWANYDKVIDPGRPVVEKLPPVQIPENATTSERLAILQTRYPEFEPLAQDLVVLSPTLDQLRNEAASQQQSKTPSTWNRATCISDQTSSSFRLPCVDCHLHGGSDLHEGWPSTATSGNSRSPYHGHSTSMSTALGCC